MVNTKTLALFAGPSTLSGADVTSKIIVSHYYYIILKNFSFLEDTMREVIKEDWDNGDEVVYRDISILHINEWLKLRMDEKV